MSSDQSIAVATDALRGLIQAALPAGSAVIVGPPSPEGEELSGLSVHLFRIGTIPALRQAPPVLSRRQAQKLHLATMSFDLTCHLLVRRRSEIQHPKLDWAYPFRQPYTVEKLRNQEGGLDAWIGEPFAPNQLETELDPHSNF